MAIFTDLHQVTLYYRPISGRDNTAGGYGSPTYGSAVSFSGLPTAMTRKQIVEAGAQKGLGYVIEAYTDIPADALIFPPGDTGTDTTTGRTFQTKRGLPDEVLEEGATDTLYVYEV